MKQSTEFNHHIDTDLRHWHVKQYQADRISDATIILQIMQHSGEQYQQK
jgi:hypothetical protein